MGIPFDEYPGCGCPCCCGAQAYWKEAVTEIERLRAALEKIAGLETLDESLGPAIARQVLDG